MATGILIKREIKGDGDAKVLMPHLIELRALAVRQPGYISGESFFNLDNPKECLVISRWTAVEHWKEWMRNPRRMELDENMEKQHGAKTEYSIYGIGLW